MPLELPMTAFPFEAFQVPVPVSESTAGAPTHTLCVPEIASGRGHTVIVAEVLHPLVSIKPMVAVPELVPKTIPVVESI